MQGSLYDLAPVWRMVLLGGVIALAPLTWVWMRRGGDAQAQRWRLLTRVLLFLTFDLVLFGAFTRLTDSGLGCPDWPGCYGNASPFGARHEIAAAAAALPSGPVTPAKAWIEMVHRYFATALGALITAAMAVAWMRQRRGERDAAPWWATATFVWVCVQGAFGALTVTMKLYPAIVTLHLLGGYAGLALLTVQTQLGSARRAALSPALARAGWALGALLVVQSALGAWVSSNYAVLACSDFPRCQGSWWPPMDFGSAFAIRRELGLDAQGGLLPFEALTAIHYTHRLAAAVVLASMLALAWALWRSGEPSLAAFARALAALAVWQLVSGLSNVVLDWPIVAALAHTGGAGAAIVCLTALLTRARAAPAGTGRTRAD